MAIQADTLLHHRFDTITQTYAPRDTILYALGIGLGADPLDEGDLDYLLEARARVLPSFAVTLASPGMWIRDPAFGVDFARLVHVEQEALFHCPLPPSGTVTARPRVAGLYDRGAGKGAVLVVEREIVDPDNPGSPYATIRQTLLLRGDGGFGGSPPPAVAVAAPPDRLADHQLAVPISPRAALIYRLVADLNPLHADPAFARKAGFERPILHGLASYGMAGRAVMRATGHGLASLSCRFAGIVMPGDIMTLSLWREGKDAYFQAHVGDRLVLDRGFARLEDNHAG